MIYQIHQISGDYIAGSVIDTIQDCQWIVVADIPRQMIKHNRVEPQHIALISGDSDESFSTGFEKFWTEHMAKCLRNWLIREHPEKLYSYQNQPVIIDNNCEKTYFPYEKPEQIDLPQDLFFKNSNSRFPNT